jgi:flagellum-specific peptidoglycan hydrolase FlgJ
MKRLIVTTSLVFSLVVYAKSQPSKTEVYQQIVSEGLIFPDIVFAQAILESGNFKSKVSRENNNFFGMRLAKVRETTAIGQKSGYAKYNSWKESVRDYKLWQDRITKKKPNITRDQYMSLLNRIYSESSIYMSQVKLIVRQNKSMF